MSGGKKMYIKGFDNDLTCRGFPFKVGQEYKIDHDGPIELCSNTAFHFCDSIQSVNEFYRIEGDNRFCIVEALGEVVTDGKKFCSDHIRIVRELTKEEVDMMVGKVNGNTGLFCSGNNNSGRWNSGSWNSGDRNSGSWNSGNWNSGNWNSGNMNSGDWNSGNWNSGNWNSGNWNSGKWNKCDFSSGVFCNETDTDIRIFNKPSGMSMREFMDSKFYKVLTSVSLEFIVYKEYTDEEKAEDPGKELIGGYLIERTPEEAWSEWWKKLTEYNRDIIKQIPNFDADVFKDITGIEV